jgi:hypothetical protein
MPETMADLSYEETKVALLKEIEGREDFVYQVDESATCIYYDFVKDEPSCLIGQVLVHQFGWTKDAFDGYNSMNAHVILSGKTRDQGAILLLDTAQEKQDMGATWGAAVASAIEKVENPYDED